LDPPYGRKSRACLLLQERHRDEPDRRGYFRKLQ
jgi:hypothetical protein